MRHYETQTVPEHTKKVLVKRGCDLCGADADKTDGPYSSYKVNEHVIRIEVSSRTGEGFPEGGSGEAIDVDICPKCFTDKLVPWLVSQGAKIEKQDWEY